MKTTRLLTVLKVLALVLTTCALPSVASSSPASRLPEVSLSEAARAQLRAVYAEKASRSPAQKKLSTRLVYAVRALRGDPEMVGVPRMGLALERAETGRIEVDITADVSSELLQRIGEVGGSVVNSFSQYRAVRAWLPLAALELLAERGDVTRIREADQPMTNKINTSQGDVAHRANLARSVHGVTGAGVKVGVLSDSVEALASLQASGDLPAVTVLPGQAGSGNSEGTAMLEIVHDLAPGSQLYFATANGGEANFANNILQLASAGCKVIVDDISYRYEPVLQDGIIAQAVDAVAASGAAYFSSAANSGNLSSGTSGTWEGDFSPGGSVDLGETAGTVHSFGVSVSNTLVESQGNAITLQWSDSWGASSNDYDLCALDASGTSVLVCSVDSQEGAGSIPLEDLPPEPPPGIRLVIVNFEGAAEPRFLHLKTHRGRLQFGTSGETSGHSAASGAFSVAAVDVATAAGGAFAGGAANPVETFSSDGPRRIFYNANGTPVTPGNFSSTGGVLRQKPDIAAADGVATATPGFSPFFGTSAAAPHAAGIAALMISANPGTTPGQTRQALTSTALDIMAPGVDRDSGFGIIDALDAVGAIAGGGSPGPCIRDAETACLLNNRFEVRVTFNTGSQGGDAQVMSFNGARTESDQSVFFYFFDNANFEMGVKMVNACTPPFNQYWAFVSGLTNVGYQVTIRDSVTGATKTYSNPLGSYPQTVGDTSALNCLVSGDPTDEPELLGILPEPASLEIQLDRETSALESESGDGSSFESLRASSGGSRVASGAAFGAPLELATGETSLKPEAPTDFGLDILGYWEWAIEGGQVHIRADNVKNSRATTSGNLGLALWASAEPVTAAGTTGHALGDCMSYAPLAAGAAHPSLVCDTSYQAPPAGCYHLTILLLEQIEGTWYYVDWVSDGLTYPLSGGSCQPTGSCTPSATRACLLNDRFEVTVSYQTATAGGQASVMSFSGQRAESDQSVFLYFFDNANFEMGVKMVDACVPPFDRFWAFVSGLTNQGYTVTIRDTVTGAVKNYSNPLGTYPQTVGDTNAFLCQ